MPAATDTQTTRSSETGWQAPVLYWVAGIALLFCYWHLFSDRYIDDAYITLSYATTLAKSGIWGMAPDLTSNAATSPLNVILLAAIIKIVRAPLLLCAEQNDEDGCHGRCIWPGEAEQAEDDAERAVVLLVPKPAREQNEGDEEIAFETQR